MKLIITQSNLTLKGGGEKVVLKIAQRYNAKIYTAEYDPNSIFEEFKDLDIEVIGRKRSRVIPYGRMYQGLNYGLSFYNLKIKEDYDVINAHMAPGHWIRNKNERVAWYCHTPLRDIYDLYEYRLSLKKSYHKPLYFFGAKAVRSIDKGVVKNIELLFANSENVKSRIEKYYGRRDATVLGGGIDYQIYKNNSDDKYFLYPSRISPNKRQEFAIRAFELFRKRVKGYKLIIVGPVSKDKFYSDYYNQIVDLARSVGDIKIITEADDKRLNKLYSNSTAVLYPPINEDYGLVPLETMASSKPIIAVNEGGPRETIANHKTGFLVNNEIEMANKMVMITKDSSIAEKIGKAGRSYVKKNHSWSSFFKVFDKKLEEIKRM